MPITAKDKICKEIADALGLPKHTKKFSLHFDINNLVTVDCTFYPDNLEDLPDIIKKNNIKVAFDK